MFPHSGSANRIGYPLSLNCVVSVGLSCAYTYMYYALLYPSESLWKLFNPPASVINKYQQLPFKVFNFTLFYYSFIIVFSGWKCSRDKKYTWRYPDMSEGSKKCGAGKHWGKTNEKKRIFQQMLDEFWIKFSHSFTTS